MTLAAQLTGGHDLAAAWLHHLVARGTAAVPAPPASASPLPDDEWDALLRAVVGGRITWTLLDATVTGDLPAKDAQLDAAADAHRTAMGLALVLERRLLDVGARLGRAGIDMTVIKGPAVARLDWDDPSQRDFGDIDILVRSRDVTAALRTLEEAGFDRPVPPMRPILDRIFAKGATLDDPDGYEVDLHRTLAPGSFGLAVPEPELWADREPFALGGVTLDALAPAVRLTHTAAHHRLGSTEPMLSTARDLLRQVGLVPVDKGTTVAETLGMTAVLVAALRHAQGEGHDLPAAWLDWLATVEVDDGEQRRLAEHDAAGGSYRAQALGSLRDVPWRWRGVVVFSWILPTDRHLAARGLTRRTYLRAQLTRRPSSRR